MVRKLLLAAALLFALGVSAQRTGRSMSCHMKAVSFEAFCKEISEKTSVAVFYDTKLLKDIKVTLDSDSTTALSAVAEALKGTNLVVSVWHDNLVILPGAKLIGSLPAYQANENKSNVQDTLQKAMTGSEERYITGRKADVAQVIIIGHNGGSLTGTKAKLLGRILDEETGEPILSATMFVSEAKTGAASDINGFISILLKPGTYHVLFEYLGYAKKKSQLEVLSDGGFSITMRKAVIEMKELVIYGDRQSNMRAKDPGLDKVSIKSIRELPMMMGERDILKISGTLPGIVSVGEGSAGLNVRGGGSDQNAFYINKIPIYNSSHLFGFFPAFNSDIIKDFSIYKGYIPAQYGGHLSSVFNIITRQGNRKHFTVHGGLSPITGNMVVEGPLKKDTSSFIFSVRSSYSDWILKQVNDPDIHNSSAKFSDLSGGVNYDIQKTQISLFAYHSSDSFRLSELNTYQYSNNGASASFSRNFTNALRGEFALIGSQYTFSTIDKQEISNAYEHAYKMEHYEARCDFKLMLNDKNALDYGAGAILYKLDRGTVMPYGPKSLLEKVELGNEKGIESAVYVSDAYDVLPWLNVTAALRYAVFTPTGPKTVYQYAAGMPLDVRYIVDTVNYKSGQAIRWYQEPDIRLAVNIKTDEAGSVKLSFNQMHQNLFMLNNTTTIAPNTQWKLADYHLSPSDSKQWSAGVFRTLAEYGLETSAELFYKQVNNFPEFKDGANFLNTPNVETAVLQGTQKAWGVEVFVKRSVRKLEGWLSYTYSRSMIRVDGDKDWSKINNGEAYPANFDIPHSVNLVLDYHLTRRITFASIFTYQTGKPVTYPVSVYYVNGLPMLDYSKRNAYRIPDYIRTDFSVTIEGSLKRQKILHSSLILSLYNATGRQNPYSVYFKTENGIINSYQYSVIAVPIFTATWLFKFGNYASE